MLIHVIAVACAGPRALRVWFDDNTDVAPTFLYEKGVAH